MKIIKKIYDENQKNFIKNLSVGANISTLTAEVLYGRGYKSVEDITAFMYPESVKLASPYTLSGMEDAVRRIISAKENSETVVVFGDYDADGICATTVLYNALKIFGVNVYTVIPERDNGYGLSENVLSEILETLYPDLIITVDCGISAKKEVEYLNDLGVDVIVTDHHEFPKELPNCVIVSTKTPNQDYKFEYLSGAGVAYKLASALIGDEADGFLDLVAVATVADSMPLIDENRILVYKGLQLIKSGKCSKAITMLLSAGNAREVSASSLAFTVAPRINAAGRMGDAYSALKLFITCNDSERNELIEKLVNYNLDRQIECESLYKSAKNLLKTQGNYGNVIILRDKNWKSGLLGIVASRLCEDYNLPTLLFTEVDGYLRGSARSTDSVNLFEAISSQRELLTDFGGHAQASGLTISENNFNEFCQRLSANLSLYEVCALEKIVEVDGEIDCPLSLKTAKELSMLEPFGTGNKKPLFLLKARKTSSKRLKEGSSHLSIKTKELDLIYFNGVKNLELLQSDVEKSLLVETGVSEYNGREYVKGFIKNVVCDFSITESVVYNCYSKAIKNLRYGTFNLSFDGVAFENALKNVNPSGFGKLFVLTNPHNLKFYNQLSCLDVCLFNLTVKGGKNTLLIGADVNEEDISDYDQIVLLDRPLGEVFLHKHQTVAVSDINSFDFSNVTTDINAMRNLYKHVISFENLGYLLSDVISGSENPYQTAFAIEVFKELEFIDEKGYFTVNKTIKKDLSESKIYQGLLKIKNA